MGLPLLDSMTPALAAPENARATRIAFVYIPIGATMAEWKPSGAGRGFQFSRILKPLEGFRDDITVLTGLEHSQANAMGDGGGGHARAGACFLTGVHPKKTAGADIRAGISADQIAAKVLAPATRFSSIELGCEDARTVGNCDSGYSCAYTNSISWRGPSTPLPPETNPRLVFERLFGSDDLSLTPEARSLRAKVRKSVLDLVQEDTKKLVGDLGPSDRRKIDEYLFAVRELETRIENAEKDQREFTPEIGKPAGVPLAFADYLKLMFDLQTIAFQADLTRVSTLMIGREGSVRVYPEIGVPEPHHPLTHHQNKAELVEKVTKINCFHAELFSHFLGKLKTTPDGDGTLLDHSMIVYASAISDGNRHLHEDLPVVLAGRGGGVKPQGHVVYDKPVPMTNLYLTLLDRMGVRPESIGDSTGKLEHLTDL